VVLTGHHQDTEGEMDQREMNRALAKALAFQRCGKDEEAAQWAHALVGLLREAGILPAPATVTLAKDTAGILAWDLSNALAKTVDEHGVDVGMDAIEPELPAFLGAVRARQAVLDAAEGGAS
jgi:hypothetical protein